MDDDKIVVPAERIEQSILFIRRQKVMLDNDLAALYGVPTKVLNQAVRRNVRRFPPDFMFRLTKEEKLELVTKCDRFRKLKQYAAFYCACPSREPLGLEPFGTELTTEVLVAERHVERSRDACVPFF